MADFEVIFCSDCSAWSHRDNGVCAFCGKVVPTFTIPSCRMGHGSDCTCWRCQKHCQHV